MDSRFKVKQITKLYESCERCGLPVINCICSIVNKINTKAKIWILSTEREFRRPSNTARLLKLADPDSTELFLWERTNHPKKLVQYINSSSFDVYILFPTENSLSEEDFRHRNLNKNIIASDNCNSDKSSFPNDNEESGYDELTNICSDPESNLKSNSHCVKVPAFIILDGTWKEAARMFRLSEYLKDIPSISLNPDHSSEYTLRRGASDGELCTVEAAIEILKLNGEIEHADYIKEIFDLFMKSFKAGASGARLKDF